MNMQECAFYYIMFSLILLNKHKYPAHVGLGIRHRHKKLAHAAFLHLFALKYEQL